MRSKHHLDFSAILPIWHMLPAGKWLNHFYYCRCVSMLAIYTFKQIQCRLSQRFLLNGNLQLCQSSKMQVLCISKIRNLLFQNHHQSKLSFFQISNFPSGLLISRLFSSEVLSRTKHTYCASSPTWGRAAIKSSLKTNKQKKHACSLRMQIWSLASLTGLRIQLCLKLQHRSQMLLRCCSDYGAGLSCSSDLTPSLGTPSLGTSSSSRKKGEKKKLKNPKSVLSSQFV